MAEQPDDPVIDVSILPDGNIRMSVYAGTCRFQLLARPALADQLGKLLQAQAKEARKVIIAVPSSQAGLIG